MADDDGRRFHGMNRLYAQLDDYERVVNNSPLSDTSKVSYIYFAWCFTRWLDNDFEPGEHVRIVPPRAARTNGHVPTPLRAADG